MVPSIFQLISCHIFHNSIFFLNTINYPKVIHKHAYALSVASAVLFLMFVIMANTSSLHAQITTHTSPQEVTLSGTLHIYLVTLYGEGLQEIDHYRKTREEGECITFILKTDEPIDMTPYLSQEEIEFLSDNGSTWQSEFMVVPDWEVFESFSNEAFAAKFANKRVRVTGSFFYPDGGWQNVTPVRMDFSKVELAE